MKRRFSIHSFWLMLLLALSITAGGKEFSTWAPPSLDEVSETLSGLTFNEFADEASRLVLLYNPSAITAYGLADQLDVRNDRLPSAGPEAYRILQSFSAVVLQAMEKYSAVGLPFSQRVSCDALSEWFGRTLETSATDPLFWPSVNPALECGFFGLVRYFELTFPRNTTDDLDDYVTALWQIEDLVDGWIEEIELSVAAGIMLPRTTGLQYMKDALFDYQSNGRIDWHPFYVLGTYMLRDVGNPSAGYYKDFCARMEDALEQSVIPAFDRLYRKLDALIYIAPLEVDWPTHPAWPAHYRNELRIALGIDLSPETIHALARAEVDRLDAEIRALSDNPTFAEPISSVIATLCHEQYDCDVFNSSQMLSAARSLFNAASENAEQLFPWQPEAPLQIKLGERPVPYFDPPPFDGTELAAFFVPHEATYYAYFLPSLVHHETIPGHYLQIATAKQADVPLLQKLNGWNGYSEGWAEYARQLAYEQRWFDNNACGVVGYLEQMLQAAVLTAVETGLAGLGWSLPEAIAYAQESLALSVEDLELIFGNCLYAPVTYTPYFVGRMVILNARSWAIDVLGDAFDLALFHQTILQYGNVPLRLIDTLVDDYIEQAIEGPSNL